MTCLRPARKSLRAVHPAGVKLHGSPRAETQVEAAFHICSVSPGPAVLAPLASEHRTHMVTGEHTYADRGGVSGLDSVHTHSFTDAPV